MVNEHTGPVAFDGGYDVNAEAFLFARLDYTVVGSAGTSVDIITSPGSGGIVHSGDRLNPDFGSINITISQDLPPISDFFWSDADLASGAINNSMAETAMPEGSSGTLYLYYDTFMSELDTGAFLNIATSTNGVIEFTNAETLEFDIVANGIPFDLRWGDLVGPADSVTANFIEDLAAINVVNGTGMVNENTGPVSIDEGYDFDAEAFLFARVDYNVVGPEGSTVDIITTTGSGGIVDSGMMIDPIFGVAKITVSNVLLGDVNCDGVVDLLDVAPFVDLISTGVFSPKADFNGDGEVSLLDVAPFVAAVAGG